MLSEQHVAFIEQNRSAAMITVGADGFAKPARVGMVIVDGNLWSSATADRVRTRRLRTDPRCTVFVWEPGYAAVTLETNVRILDGPDVPELSIKLFREMQGKPSGPLSWFGRDLDDDAFRQAMADEGRVIYEFEVLRAYGL